MNLWGSCEGMIFFVAAVMVLLSLLLLNNSELGREEETRWVLHLVRYIFVEVSTRISLLL